MHFDPPVPAGAPAGAAPAALPPQGRQAAAAAGTPASRGEALVQLEIAAQAELRQLAGSLPVADAPADPVFTELCWDLGLDGATATATVAAAGAGNTPGC
ncbi:hypothetical protein [Stenotrophomonas sp. MMGLT7]|uniref:hypothetical protein n=1 Tax=Stenotrophomonas sp. MMGLT7 TaxID=2901227 RepID=UPI001E3B133B|nr:hypothetical protein [Stenotrophomonas sp. MMGLT7]MCD7100235.1 hypothetical protein [Stenotrophomonas sp. MMGLT7]